MMRAQFDSECVRCHDPIRKGDPIAPHHGGYVHTRCAPGADDE